MTARRDSAYEAAPELGSFHPKSLAAEGAGQGFLSFEKIGLKRVCAKKMDAHHEHPFFLHLYGVANWLEREFTASASCPKSLLSDARFAIRSEFTN